MSMAEHTTAWQHLEVGVTAGCTISPLAFTMAMEVIIRASRWVVGGQQIRPGLRLPPVRAYMDDLTTLKGKLSDQRFHIGDEAIPTVSEKPVKSLGQWQMPPSKTKSK